MEETKLINILLVLSYYKINVANCKGYLDKFFRHLAFWKMGLCVRSGMFTAEMNSVEEGAGPLDTFIKLSGETSLTVFSFPVLLRRVAEGE
jgi:hypothetical protein